MIKYRLLCLENDPNFSEMLTSTFGLEGLALKAVASAEALVDSLKEMKWDALLLDMNAPNVNGYSLCEQARSLHPTMPILMVSSQTDEESAVKGLLSGANDYIRKPVGFQETVLKIKRALGQFEQIRIGDLVVDTQRRTVAFQEKQIELRRREFDIFVILIKHMGKVVTRREILDAIQLDKDASFQIIDCHLSRLRKKLKEAGAEFLDIKGIYGVGYTLKSIQ